MHHPPLRTRLVVDLSSPTIPHPHGIEQVIAYANSFDLLVTVRCARPGRQPLEQARAFDCVDRELCPRMVARWLAARAMWFGSSAEESLAWAERVAEEIVERLHRPPA